MCSSIHARAINDIGGNHKMIDAIQVANRPPNAINILATERVLRPVRVSNPFMLVNTQKKLSLTWQISLAPDPAPNAINNGLTDNSLAIGKQSVAAVMTATVPDP